MNFIDKKDEINVYVISKEQPFENWFGIWRYFIKDGYYVENNKGKLIKVNENDVYEVDTNLNIINFIKIYYNIQILMQCNLTYQESINFIHLINKLNIPNEWKVKLNEELQSEVILDFTLSESLILLKENIQDEP